MATLNLENLRAERTRLNAQAAELWAAADGLRTSYANAGTDITQGEPFDKIVEAFRAYDEVKDGIAQLEQREGQLHAIESHYRGPGERLPMGGQLPQERSAGGLILRGPGFSPGARLVASAEYADLRERGAFANDAAFRSMAQNGLARPVDVMTRDELQATLAYIRGMATTITGGGATSAGPFIQNDLVPGFVSYLRKRPTLASIVGQGATDSDVVEYVTQSAPTNNMAETAEASAAPEQVYPFATATTNVREITGFVPITLRAMADAGQLRSLIENELAMDALDRLDTQLASGDGTGVNLTGIYNVSGIGTFALGAYTATEALHRAITTVRVAAGVLSECDYIGMHPNDWQKLRLERDANGRYIMGDPGFAGAEQVWGIPVIPSTVFTEGTPLTGNFGRGAMLWLREALSVTSGLNSTDFVQRQITLLAALRVAFAVTRPGAFCAVTSF